MEALSPVRLLPLFFWQGSNDDAQEREPDTEGLSQREAFPEAVSYTHLIVGPILRSRRRPTTCGRSRYTLRAALSVT